MPYQLERLATLRSDDIFVVHEDASTWTYKETFDLACRFGRAISDAGLKEGHRMIVWMPNGRRALQAYFGCGMAGVSFVGINTAYKGGILEHVIANSSAPVMLAHPELASRLLDVNLPASLKVVYTDLSVTKDVVEGMARKGIEFRDWDALTASNQDGMPVRGLKPWSEQSICYTSGTTGPSKGVLSSFIHMHEMGAECLAGVTSEDRVLLSLPLFHVGGTLYISGALALGASIACITQFQTKSFLPVCKQLGVTSCILLGAMAGFLLGQPASDADKDHSLRLVMVIPLSEDASVLKARFGFDVYTLFNMSEISCQIRSGLNPTVRGAAGTLRAGAQARIVDAFDCEVQDGEVGELVLRTDRPWTLSHGYNNMPEATAKAWRNGWFHTGDNFRKDAEGNYFFVDRAKDAIRRRGENISSFEVESEVMAHEAVLEAAAVGLANEISEQDVMVALALKPGHTLEPLDLIDFLSSRMPHFMVPRYVRIMESLPKTPTAKIEKHVLRSQGVTLETWDREREGVTIKRTKLSA